MKIIKRKDIINLSNEKITVSQAITYLSRIPIDRLVDAFKSNSKLPRHYRMNVLRSVLQDEISKIRLLDETLASNISYRLKWFEQYTEFQLLELLEKRQTTSNQIAQYYIEDFWLMILQVGNQFGVSDETFIQWIESAKTLPDVVYDTKLFNEKTNRMFEDKLADISGISSQAFREVATESMTIAELRRFSALNDIKLPQSVTKSEIVPLVIEEAIRKYPDNIENLTMQIESMSFTEIKRYIQDEKLDVRYDIRKDSLIDIVIQNYLGKTYEPILEEISFNLPLRKKIDDVHMYHENIAQSSVLSDENQKNYAFGHVNLNMYYEGVTQDQIMLDQVKFNQETNTLEVYGIGKQKIRRKRSFWRWLLNIIVFLVILVVVTVLCVVILDLTGLARRDSNPISQFIFELLFRW